MKRGASLADRARNVMPGGVNSGQRCVPGLEDLVITGAHGSRLTDHTGRSFVDFHLAFGPIILGHADPDVDLAASAAARRVDPVGVGRTREEIELAELLSEMVPTLERVLFTMSGSEATFHALRLARAVTGRRYIVKFQGCFHGWHDAIAMNVISEERNLGGPDPMSSGMMPDTVASTLVLPFNDVNAIRELMSQRGAEIAAVIVEPIPHSVGVILPNDDFLPTLRELCDRYGAVLIFDEIVTGFRHGLGGYQAIAGIRPDLTVLGKAMANGYPVAALGGRSDLMDEFTTRPGGLVLFQGTYNGHPMCMAAARATIEKLRELEVHEHLFRLGAKARAMLTDALSDTGVPTFTTGYGSVFVTYFLEPPVERYEDLLRNEVALFVGQRQKTIAEGFLQLPLNLKRNQVSFAHSDEEIEGLVDATRRAVLELAAHDRPLSAEQPRIPELPSSL